MLRVAARVDYKESDGTPKGASIRSPLDRRRYPSWYSGDLDPETLGDIIALAEYGDLGPLQEVSVRIRGRDPIISGLVDTRLAAVSGCKVKVWANESDQNLAAIEAAIFVESWLSKLRLFKRNPSGLEEVGGFTDVLESLASVWYSGVLPIWIYYKPEGNTLTPFGVEALEPRRVRVDQVTGEIKLETADSYTGIPLSSWSPLLWFTLSSSRAGVPLCYAGAASKILFPWWLGGLSDEALSKYLDRFGVPIPVAKEPLKDTTNGGYDETSSGALDLAVKNIHTDNLGMVIPGAATIEIFQAAMGGEKLYEFTRKECERRINYALAGQTGTNIGEGGSYAKAKVNYAVRADLIQRDKQVVASALERLAQRALWFFFRGKVQSVPRIVVYDPSIENPDGSTKPEQATNG